MTAKRTDPTEKRPPTHTPRSVRVPVSEIQVRISSVTGQLISISATGVSVRISLPLAIGNDFSLYLPNEAFPIKVRVVGAEPVMVELPGATWLRKEFVIGLMFLELLPKDKEAIVRLCGEAFGTKE